MSKKKRIGNKFKIGDKVIIKNRPVGEVEGLGIIGPYHIFEDGEIGVIMSGKDDANAYSVRLSQDKRIRPLIQGIFEKDLIKS